MGNETWIMKKTFICKQASKQRDFFLFFSYFCDEEADRWVTPFPLYSLSTRENLRGRLSLCFLSGGRDGDVGNVNQSLESLLPPT